MIHTKRAHKVVVNPRIPVEFKRTRDQLEGHISDKYEEWIVQDQVIFIWLPPRFLSLFFLVFSLASMPLNFEIEFTNTSICT